MTASTSAPSARSGRREHLTLDPNHAIDRNTEPGDTGRSGAALTIRHPPQDASYLGWNWTKGCAMATKRAGKAKQRARKSSSRPSQGGSHLSAFDGQCREVLRTDGRDVLRGGDPLDAELWVSQLVGLFRGLPLVGEDDPVTAIGGRLVSVAKRSRTPEAQMCLRALAATADGPLGRRAEAAARELAATGAPAPGWIDAIGTAEPTAAWRATDLCGDQDSIMIGFAFLDGDEHSVVVLIDHPLGGIAKDAAVLGPLAEVVRSWEDVADIELVEEPIEVAAARVIEAMEWTRCTLDAPVTEDFVATEAWLRARLGPLAGALPDIEPLGDAEREALVRAFLTDDAGSVYAHDPGAWFLIECLVDFRCDQHGRDPLRWNGAAAAQFLLDWVPRKVSAEEASLVRMPEVLRAWVGWASRQAALPVHLATETVETISQFEAEFAEAITDERHWGPAKRLMMSMLASGIDPSDTAAANAWLTAQVPA